MFPNFVELPGLNTDDIIPAMKKDYLPIAIGFWGTALPLLVSAFFYCRTLPEKIAISISSFLFFLLGFLIYKAK